jgi:hypothetical protein
MSKLNPMCTIWSLLRNKHIWLVKYSKMIAFSLWEICPSFSRVREHDCPLWIPLSLWRYLHFILVLILYVVIVKHPMLWILFYGFNVSTCLQISMSDCISLHCCASLTVMSPLSVTLPLFKIIVWNYWIFFLIFEQ